MSEFPAPDTVIIPIVEERAELQVREFERGRVRIDVAVDEREALAGAVLHQEEVDVERVPIGRTVATRPPVREEGEVLIVPLVEERLVVRTELVLKEELRITRRRRAENVSMPVRLRSERAEVTRSQGRPPSLNDSDDGTPQMDERNLTALYDTKGAAESARAELLRVGVPAENVSVRAAEGDATAGLREDRGFWGSLSDLFMPDDDRQTYAEGMRRGGSLLTANVPAGLEDEALTVLEQSESIDLDERSESWRQSGWTGQTEAYAAGAGVAPVLADEGSYRGNATTSRSTDTDMTGATAAAAGGIGLAGTSAASGRTLDGEDKLQVVEEQLRVGKREVGRGSVRVRSYVTERPVEEQVELRQERVTIERRPVDRELRADDPAFEERTIEAVERGEEAVVAKTARVVEEIAIGKEVERETETVRDTVRKQDVEIVDDRGLGATRTDADTTVTDSTIVADRTPLDPTTR